MLPPSKPRLSSTALRRLLAPHALDRTRYPLVVVGVRGYYRNTMGAPGVNDRGIYDDALFIDSANVTAAFNANTDPSVARKGMAVLAPGLYLAHRLGLHRGQYRALVQRAGPVTVVRDQSITESGYFGINIHKGSTTTTSSEGCQTIPPAQWDAFINTIVSEAKRTRGAGWLKLVVPYLLLEESSL